MKVHNTLGNGFQEVIYQRWLAIELKRSGLGFSREIEQTIYYEGIDIGTRRADFVVEEKVKCERTSQPGCVFLFSHAPKLGNPQRLRKTGLLGADTDS